MDLKFGNVNPAPQKHLGRPETFENGTERPCVVRGTTEKFYEWLEHCSADVIPDGPPIWISGDCYLRQCGTSGKR
jgi:hypothetical protein